ALFIGIFLTMVPALEILKAQGGELGVDSPARFFWVAGILSSFLDNAPTYLVFFKTAQGMVEQGLLASADMVTEVGIPTTILQAISVGAVFMGANTYIGNGPNFMVQAIAEEQRVEMPSFFGYMRWARLILLPALVLVPLIFILRRTLPRRSFRPRNPFSTEAVAKTPRSSRCSPRRRRAGGLDGPLIPIANVLVAREQLLRACVGGLGLFPTLELEQHVGADEEGLGVLGVLVEQLVGGGERPHVVLALHQHGRLPVQRRDELGLGFGVIGPDTEQVVEGIDRTAPLLLLEHPLPFREQRLLGGLAQLGDVFIGRVDDAELRERHRHALGVRLTELPRREGLLRELDERRRRHGLRGSVDRHGGGRLVGSPGSPIFGFRAVARRRGDGGSRRRLLDLLWHLAGRDRSRLRWRGGAP